MRSPLPADRASAEGPRSPAGSDHALDQKILQRVLPQLAWSKRLQKAVLLAVKSRGLSDLQLLLLWAVVEGEKSPAGGLSQMELAQYLGTSGAQVSELVEQFRRRGWMNSERSTEDRRRQIWRATSAGRAILSDACACLAELDEGLLASFATVASHLGAAASRATLPLPAVTSKPHASRQQESA